MDDLMRFSKIQISIFLTSFALTCLFMWLLLPSKKNMENLYFTQGYDFHKLRRDNSDIDLVKIGEKLDVENIKDSKGNSLLSYSNQNLTLLVAIDPSCPACNFSKDMMNEISLTTKSIKVSYYPLLISSINSNFDVQKYTQSLGFVDYFYLSSETPAQNALKQIITPSHILLDEKGTVIQVWYGSNKDEEVRKRMSDQISADLILIRDIFEMSPIVQISR